MFILFLFLAALGLHCWAWALSSFREQGLLFVAVRGLLIAVASLVAEHGLQAHRLQQLWLVGCRGQAQQLWHTGLVAPQHVGSSRTRARTHVPCIGRRILNHCATREALLLFLLLPLLLFIFLLLFVYCLLLYGYIFFAFIVSNILEEICTVF